MKAVLSLKASPETCVYAGTISPDAFVGKAEGEIGSLKVNLGRRETNLEDLFTIEVKEDDSEEVTIELTGDLKWFRRIGEGMRGGKIIIKGDVGMHVGVGMRGGTITVEGDASDWVGAEMKGGNITVKGSAGNYAGAGYRGGTPGMKKGSIEIDGDAGDHLGEFMGSGEITVKGKAGVFPGYTMANGIIRIAKGCTYPGGEMKKGSILVEGDVVLLPTFKEEEAEEFEGEKRRKLVGDMASGGKGSLYLPL